MRTGVVAFCLLALCVLAATPASAQLVIRRGIDVFQTPLNPPSLVDFSIDPIPAGFFCSGSAPFTGAVQFVGAPLDTVPAGVLNGADTVIERLQDVTLVPGGSGTTPVVVRGLRLTSNGTIAVFCPDEGRDTEWRVDACLCGTQPPSRLTLTLNSTCGCGVANGTLRLNVCLRFTRVDTGEVLGPLSRPIELLVQNMPWCDRAGPNSLTVAGPLTVRSACCDCGDSAAGLPGTSNFFPGQSCTTVGADCWAIFASLTRCHEGPSKDHPHCVNPVCGKRN